MLDKDVYVKMRTEFYPFIDEITLQHFIGAGTNVCTKCGKEFKINDNIHSRIGGGQRNKTKNYHKECWEKTLN